MFKFFRIRVAIAAVLASLSLSFWAGRGVRVTAANDHLHLDVYVADNYGWNVTSTIIYGKTEAVLVDAQSFNSHAAKVADRIAALGRKLTTIVITHAHDDHYNGLALIHQRFPDAKIYMSADSLEDYRKRSPNVLVTMRKYYPNDTPDAYPMPEQLPNTHLTVDGEAVEVIGGQGDEFRAKDTALWIPSLRALVTGDMVFNRVHVWLGDSNAESRAAWLESLDRLAALKPKIVVAGHKRSSDTPDSADAIEITRKYIKDFESARKIAANPDELIGAMKVKYPDFALPDKILPVGARRSFPPPQPTGDAQLISKVDAYLRPYIDLGGFSGAILIAKGGKVLMNKSYGMANYELNVPNGPNTRFHLGSVSKTFTAAAIMMLQERGLLNVNDPLSKYIPDYPNGDRIKLYHLLTNTSGIPNVNNFPEYAAASRTRHTPADLVEIFKQKPLDFQPGSRDYVESNSNYNLLAFIIEKLSGQSYGDFLRTNIFSPLGLKDTDHDGTPSTLVPNRAVGYVPTGLTGVENAPFIDWSVKTGNGSIYSTTQDIYQWDRALYTEKILKKSSIEEMLRGKYGWFADKRLGRDVVRMNGRSPGFNSDLQRFINDDVCIIVLANNYSPTASVIGGDLAKIVFGEPYETPKLTKAQGLEPSTLAGYSGTYKFGQDFFVPGGIYTIEERNGQLVMIAQGVDTILTPLSDSEFFHRPFWSRLKFQKDASGHVTDLIWQYSGQEYRASKVS